MTVVRRHLAAPEMRRVETCYRVGRYFKPGRPLTLTVAGRVMLCQQPPTAKGMLFVTIEDETGHIQCVTPPEVQERRSETLREGALIVRGRLEIEGNWRGIYVRDIWPLAPLFGSYEGHPSAAGGRDRHVTARTSSA